MWEGARPRRAAGELKGMGARGGDGGGFRLDLEGQGQEGRGRSPARGVPWRVVRVCLGGAGCLLGIFLLRGALGGAALGGRRGERFRPSGVVDGVEVAADTLPHFDKSHIYRFKATDHSYFRALWKQQSGEAGNILRVEGLQEYIDSVPELKKMQMDSLGYPDTKFYDQFTRYTPCINEDMSMVRGHNVFGFRLEDGYLSVAREYGVAKTAKIYGVDKDLAEAIDSPQGMNNSGNFYYPPGGFREWHTNKCQQRKVPEDRAFKFEREDSLFESTQDCKGHRATGGWRGYMVFAQEPHKSWMSVIDGAGDFRTLVDRTGYVSLFYLPGGSDNSWHTIFSTTHRWSIGFRITEEFLDQWLLPDLQKNNVMVEDLELNLNRNWLARFSAAEKGT